jgi:sugar/nucleoside kinase (ribokinase family)
MQSSMPIKPIDYLVIGHLTQDLTLQGPKLGGTAAYAALTAKALGLQVGIVTAIGPEANLGILEGIQIVSAPSEKSTTFENIATPNGRKQFIHNQAALINIGQVPQTWRETPIIHLGPIAQEVDPNLARYFPNSFLGITPQGWLRDWDKEGNISPGEWPEASFVLQKTSAAVLSIEDVRMNEERIQEMVSSVRILVVTEGAAGARVYWNGDQHYFRPPIVTEIDPTGAGDIFAAAFFIHLNRTQDPWEAAQFATLLAANSVTRPGLLGIPTPQEVEAYSVERLRY